MFESSEIYIMLKDGTDVQKLIVDNDTQTSICTLFETAVNRIKNKSAVEFNGEYKADSDEYQTISSFMLDDKIKEALKTPEGLDKYKKDGREYPEINAIFVGSYSEDTETGAENYEVAFQKIKKDQYISTRKINLLDEQGTFKKNGNYGLSIRRTVDCFYTEQKLCFESFFFARQVFDLGGYYRVATEEEVKEFSENGILYFDNPSAFSSIATATMRRKIAMINDSGILKNYSAKQIKSLANKIGIKLSVSSGKLIVPIEKDEIKLFIDFLNNSAYKSVIDGNTYTTNSKRRVNP